ncbi:hypothetical protein F4813DRAFT_371661 [Daldinia decipiens]|uniref:uncharacterized protein n=1 Tax=Daldinia decipiens TaxID=326647 RepID=UPI0020C1B9B9|nr:uncharacterized protein F4813DRAFT_371661 [Daldinia decipiens]KAI1654151.1 hypothetical protein F4813DRAFT_371661 [Daldinia decipiens]
MEYRIGESFLILSSSEESDELSEPQPDRINREPRGLSNRANSTLKKKNLFINTSFDINKPDSQNNAGQLLRSEVANALGIDARSLPQSFHGLIGDYDDSSSVYSCSSNNQQLLDGSKLAGREDSVGPVSDYSPPVDSAEWRKSIGDLVEKRLSAAMTSILGADGGSMPLDESFLDLGGNFRKARELRAECMDAGLAIKTRDIMNSKTIAELKTHITPLIPRKLSERTIQPTTVSPLEPGSLEIQSDKYQYQMPDYSQPPAIPPKAAARYSLIQPQLRPTVSRRRYARVEKILYQHSDVSKASVLKSKAGPFEGRLVAFATLTCCVVDGPDDCEVKLQSPYYTIKLPSIRNVVESQVPPSLVPNVWIVLEKMPLDDSGNINRRKLQTWIQNVNDDVYHQILSIDSRANLRQPTNVIERRLQKTASRVLQMDQTGIGMNMSFASMGGDEKAATKCAAECESRGICLDTEDIMQATSLTELAALATSSKSHSRNIDGIPVDTFELSPMQRLYFHTSMGSDVYQREARNSEYRFNQSILFRLKRAISVEDVTAAVEAVVGHHYMLRCRFRRSGSSWCQSIESDISSSYHFAHHTVTTDAEVEKVVRASQETIDIETGPVFAAHHFHTRDGRQMLYMVAHHLVVDSKSWHVIADDLEGLLTKGYLISGHTLSFREWTLHYRHRIRDMELPFDVPVGNYKYWGIDPAFNKYGNTLATGFTLSADVTLALEASCRALQTGPVDLFIAALILSFAQGFHDRPLPTLWKQVNERSIFGTGRNVSETVGWFTSLCPVAIDSSPTDTISTILGRVKGSKHATTDKGALKFTKNLIDSPSALSFISSYCPLELMFTYAETTQNVQRQDTVLEQLPTLGRMLAPSMLDIGSHVGRLAVFEVSISVEGGETNVNILYHKNSAHQEKIHSWFYGYEKILRQTAEGLQYESSGISSSDVLHISVTDEELNRLNTTILPRLNLNISNIEAIYPATETQQDIIINQALVPGSSRALMICDLETSDRPVDISRICAAWLQVTSKHSALRTVFAESASNKGLYDQIVLRSHSPTMLFLESDTVEDAMASIDNLPPLSLNEGIPWHRLIVCQVAGKTFVKLEASQAACDVASMAILFKEIEQAYFHGLIPSGPKASYPQYAQYLKTASSNIDFWKRHLGDIQPCSFPILVSQPHILSGWETMSIDLDIPCERLKDLANEYNIDISTILTVAWGLLLRNYTGKDSVCFGHRIAGRDFPVENLRNTVGSFSTILASKLEIRAEEFVAQLLLNAERDRIQALNHQNVPIRRVEHELHIRGGRLFNTYLSFGYEYISHETSTSSKCQHIRTEQASEYDVGVDVYFHDGNITVDIGYRILNSDQAITVACAFGRAVEAILDSPTIIVQEVDLFTMRDHEQILAWNSMPQADIPKGHVHDLVAHQASLNPEIQAICAWDGDLSYGNLHDLSIVLAKHLLASGLKPQMPVPVVMDKSRWAVVAMLAILHAGAILVPLDVEIPSIIPWSIQKVSADFVLCSTSSRRHVDSLGVKVIIVDQNAVLAMSAQTVDMDLLHPAPYEIACILFSAEPTGTFKCISYSHGSLAAACVGQGSTLLINPSSRVMQLSSYNIDIALSETFTTLVNGGCVCIPSASERITGFSEATRRMHINWICLTPTLSRKLDPESLPDLSIVCIRARHLDDDVYAPWIGKVKVLMAYGSPEAGPLALSATEVTDSKASQCFGNPFYGNFWIVSRQDSNRLMPVGALGELIIGGPALATGLDIHEPDIKTWVEKSAVSPMSLLEKSGSRLLKTGDYARYLEDGRIEFVLDDGGDAEINGKKFRLSVVEPKLRQCLGRGIDVVVETIAFNDSNSDPILAAFVDFGDNALKKGEGFSNLSRTTKERLYLSKKIGNMALRDTLPSYMVPSAYIPVKGMPLTPTLEVNRMELQRMIAGSSRKQLLGMAEISNPQELQDISFKPLPLTEVEHGMRVVWAQVLDVEEGSITASDRFLTLGGDIILARELVRECKQRGVGISIIDVLRNISLAEICRGGVGIEIYPTAIQEVSEPTQSNHPTSPTSKAIVSQLRIDGSLIEDATETSSLQAMFIESGMLQTRGNIDYLEISITGSLDWRKLQDACFMLTDSHPILRTAFASHSRQLYQAVYRSHRPEFLRYQCQSWRLGNLTAKLIKREQAQLVDFSQPVTKFSYFDAGKSSVLIIRLSRAQYDELSLPRLVRDLTQFYNHSDRPVRRPGFCEVVRASHRAHSNSTVEYWRTLLEGAAVTQIIPQPSPAKVSLNHTTLHRKIPTRSLHSLGISFETILKGAWSVVLSNLSATDDVVFGQLVDRRNLSLPSKQNISDVVGTLGNILPVRTRLPDIPITPYEYFRCVQSQHVASMSQNMQLSDIIQKATSWPSWTRLSTVIYHKNQIKDAEMIEFTIGNATCKLNYTEINHPPSDIFVKSCMLGPANVDISLTFSEKITLSFADEVLGMLCSVISLLTSTFVMEPLYLKGLGDNHSASRIPLPAPKRDPSIPQTVEPVEPDLARTAHTIISSAWDVILEAHSLKVPDIRSVPFYEIWGSLIPAAELAKYYTDNMPSALGVEQTTYTAEEIVDHPTMMQQYELIIAKHRVPHSRRNRNTMLIRTQSVWGRSIRRLPRVSVAPSASAPRSNHRPMGSSTSMESMTTGSSLSDDDELKEHGIYLIHGAREARGNILEGKHSKATKKGPSLLGKMLPKTSG